ncbi:hypothetical protein [Gloeocapsopsis dulcis]|nr:hypothetical protein [Gloeocapsopsis dulcis]WNN89906.1 hypothetical protein P0S91_02070 [Gloeocapsopsis dulcis]
MKNQQSESLSKPSAKFLNFVARRLSLFTAFLVTSVVSTIAFMSSATAQLVYQVTITGSVLQYPFQRTGFVVVSPTVTRVTQNDVNPFEVALASGNPYTSPQRGAIWLATNNNLVGSRANLDLAYVNYNPSTAVVTIRPDSRIAATGTNIFTVMQGITATPYQIYGGYMQLQFRNNFQQIAGQIDVVGRGLTFSPWNRYTATISGVRVQ